MPEISIPRKEPKLITTQQFKNYSKDAFCYDLHKVFQTQSSQSSDPD